MRTLPAGCGCEETACEYARVRDGVEVRCSVKPSSSTTPVAPLFNPKVPACQPCAAEPWVLLAEVKTGGNELSINNEVRRVVLNTPSLLGV